MGLEQPRMGGIGTQMDGVTAFAGYNHNLRINANEFYDMENITGAKLPVVSARGRRARLRKLEKPNGLFAHEKLCWVDGTDFYYGGIIKGQVMDSEKQFVRMGAYVLIWPDKMYYNTHTDEYGPLEASVTTTEEVAAILCKHDGSLYENYAIGDTAPEDPENGALWLDTGSDPNVLRQYVDYLGMWNPIPTVYTMIASAGIGVGFEEFDGVTLSGFENEELNGEFYLIGRDDDYLIVTALIREALLQTAPVTVARKVPDMEYITECNNRIWGCSSAKHEIYACVLGDPKNWNVFLGVSTDSYAVTVGSGGEFTGACTHLGSVLFFKETVIHQLMGHKPANFQLSNTNSRGVGHGNEKSVCIVNETLFYCSVSDVCSYGAALPTSISAPLGAKRYKNAVGGAFEGRYYLCMEGLDGDHTLFTFDTYTGVWCKEDGADVRWFATLENELYFLDGEGLLWSVNGTGMAEYGDGEARLEEPVPWMLETGDMGLDAPYSKHISGIQLYGEADLGTTLRVELQYDGTGGWAEVYRSAPLIRQSMVLPIIPRRCRTLRMRIRGTGGFLLYSIVKKTEQGSDVYAAR